MKLSNSLLFTFFLLFACGIMAEAQERRTVDVSGFEGVNLGGSGTAYVTQGSSYSVEFVGSDELFEEMKFEVRGNQLNIGKRDRNSWGRSSGRYEVYVTLPEIHDLSVSGSGRMIIEKTFSTDDLDLAVSGSGRIQTRVKASTVDVAISGSGEIEVIGEATSLDATISGSGKMNGKEFNVGSVDARISGSGSIYVHAKESIDSRISGSGNIYYSGEPRHINNNSSGSGKIRKMD